MTPTEPSPTVKHEISTAAGLIWTLHLLWSGIILFLFLINYMKLTTKPSTMALEATAACALFLGGFMVAHSLHALFGHR